MACNAPARAVGMNAPPMEISVLEPRFPSVQRLFCFMRAVDRSPLARYWAGRPRGADSVALERTRAEHCSTT
jgi:hypothetical protein